MAAKTAEPIET